MEDMSKHYSLVMPFVTVESVDGPHQDESYTAGWEMGMLYNKLCNEPQETQVVTVRTESLPQLDLILMHTGYTSAKLERDPEDDSGMWTGLVLIPQEII